MSITEFECLTDNQDDYTAFAREALHDRCLDSDHKKSMSMNLYSDKTIIFEELKYVNSTNNVVIFAVAAAAATFAIIAKVFLSKPKYRNLINFIHSDADTGMIDVTGKINQENMKDFGSDAGSMWVPTKWWTCLDFNFRINFETQIRSLISRFLGMVGWQIIHRILQKPVCKNHKHAF